MVIELLSVPEAYYTAVETVAGNQLGSGRWRLWAQRWRKRAVSK